MIGPVRLGLLGFATAAGALVQFLLNRGLLRRKDTSASSDSQKHSTAAGDAQVKAAGLGTTVVAQQEVQRLQAAYASMAAAFTANGLDLAAVAETAEWFDKGPAAPWPRRYANFTPHPLAPASVRLIVVPIAANCPQLASLAAVLSGEVLALLPHGCKAFSNARQNLHITIFHTSHPGDSRPDPLDPYSGLAGCPAQQPEHKKCGVKPQPSGEPHHGVYNVTASTQQSVAAAAAAAPALSLPLNPALLPPPHERPGPTDQQLLAEQHAAGQLVAATAPFTLQVERVLLARSGVLLLTWTDPTGALGKLRRQLHHTFPGACSKQSNIIHTSLFRVVETPLSEAAAAAEQATGASQQQHSSQLSVEAVAAITAACERWTEKLHGAELAVSQLWWVSEEEFSSIEGVRLPFTCTGQQAALN